MSPEGSSRPTSVTVICVVGFTGALLTLPLLFSPIPQRVGSWYPPYLGFSLIVGLVCMVGLWMMKKWAVFTYIGFVAFNQAVLLAMGVWNILALLIPAIVILVAVRNLAKMS